MRPSPLSLAAAALLAASLCRAGSPATMSRFGVCDASAAVAVGPRTFIVAGDENNVLRAYGPTDTTPRSPTFDLSSFLGLKPGGSEADIEGATRIGDVIYWITSHGADKKGRPRPSGRRLFATKVEVVNGRVELTPMGTPYEMLVEDFLADPELKSFDLKAAAKRPPKSPNALNIEGLAATPTGELLIGFRNPIPKGKALVVAIENPKDVVMGKARARLGTPVLLPLSGLGIRSIEYAAARSEYLIVAGPDGVTGPFRLYRWSGSPSGSPEEIPDVPFTGLQPEALIVYPEDPNTIEILSDDGTVQVHGVTCKDLPTDQQVFRSFIVKLQ